LPEDSAESSEEESKQEISTNTKPTTSKSVNKKKTEKQETKDTSASAFDNIQSSKTDAARKAEQQKRLEEIKKKRA
jgi:hypothetical protein